MHLKAKTISKIWYLFPPKLNFYNKKYNSEIAEIKLNHLKQNFIQYFSGSVNIICE
jgi:hypothetical protein